MDTGLQWLIWGVLMTLIMGAVARAWKRQAAAFTSDELHHPTVIAVIGAAVGLLFLAATVGAALSAPTTRELWVVAVPAGFAGLGGYLFYEWARVRYVVKADGFEYRTALSGAGFARWGDVRTVEWVPSMSWFTITLEGGRKVRVSVLILGLDRLARALLDNCRVDLPPLTRDVLTRTAAGNPPSPWG